MLLYVCITPLFLLFVDLLQLLLTLLLLNNQGVLIKTIDKMLAHFLVSCLSKFKVLPPIVKMSMKGRLECEAVHNVVFLRQNDPSRLSFGVFIFELTRMVSKLRSLLAEQLWNDSRSVVFIRGERKLRPIDEHILLPRVAMHINESHDVLVPGLCPLLGFASCIVMLIWALARDDAMDKALDGANFWVQMRVWVHIASVKIITGHRCPVVACNDSVDVCHWDNLEDEPLSELFRLERVSQ